jgi:hypothetical protein
MYIGVKVQDKLAAQDVCKSGDVSSIDVSKHVSRHDSVFTASICVWAEWQDSMWRNVGERGGESMTVHGRCGGG